MHCKHYFCADEYLRTEYLLTVHCGASEVSRTNINNLYVVNCTCVSLCTGKSPAWMCSLRVITTVQIYQTCKQCARSFLLLGTGWWISVFSDKCWMFPIYDSDRNKSYKELDFHLEDRGTSNHWWLYLITGLTFK